MAKYDVAIIGGGPGGYVTAIRAAQLGLKTALVEKERVGGLCLNWGCIPSKALLWNAEVVHLFQRAEEFGVTYKDLRVDMAKAVTRSRDVVERMVSGVEFLLKKNGVDVVQGEARFRKAGELSLKPSGSVSADHVIIATGAVARALPGVPIDGKVVITSREALEVRRAPKSAVIVGGGAVGCEFAYLWRTYGSEVTVVEMLDRLLPMEDEEISKRLEVSFRQQGIKSLTGARVEGVDVKRTKAAVRVSAGGKEQELAADKVLVGIGMEAATKGLGLDAIGVKLDRGFIDIDERMRTSVKGVYAAGDVTGKLLLAHVASAQGVACVEAIAGKAPPPFEYVDMPRATFCQPQVASVGLTEAQAREQGRQVKVGRFPFRANPKAMAMGATEGLVKVVADAGYGEMLGCHVIGPDAAELLGEASLGRTLETTARELGFAVHIHPTLSEALKEAALAVGGEAVHFWREESKA